MLIIGGKFRSHRLLAPKGLATRPTSARLREAVFNIVQNEIEGANFLDIFAGSGAMGIEALSRGARHTTFIELDRESARCLQTNLQALKISSQSSVLIGDFLQMLEALLKKGAQFDIIYADAPYQMVRASTPISQILAHWMNTHSFLKPSGKLFIEDDQSSPPLIEYGTLAWLNSRRAGKAYLHQFIKNC